MPATPAPATTPPAPAPPAAPRPLDAARDQLQAALTARHAALPEAERALLPAPSVVPLGAADTLGTGAPDPYAAARPAATVHLTSRAVLTGPWLPEGAGPETAGACGQCLAMRWQRLRGRTEREALERRHVPHGATGWPVVTDWAVDAVWAAYRAVHRPGRTAPEAEEPADRTLPRVTRTDLVTLATATFPLLPDPLCPACVTPRPETAGTARLTLDPAPKPDPGTYRVRPLGAYALPVAALANPVCGALGSDTWINPASTTTAPVAGTHFVRGYAGLTDVTWSGQANRTATSRRLAFLEGLERYAGTHRRRGTTPVLGSYHQLAADALDPRTCGVYAPETYANDPLLSPFDPDREIPWVRGHSLRDERPVLVPARLAHYSAGVDADNFVFECSNGCATGSGLAEAILFGLLERVERDAFLLAWYGRARLTEIDLATLTDPEVRAMTGRAALHGYDIHVYDTRMGPPVPVVTALAVRRDWGPRHPRLRRRRRVRPRRDRRLRPLRGPHLHPAPALPGHRTDAPNSPPWPPTSPSYGNSRTTPSSTACPRWRTTPRPSSTPWTASRSPRSSPTGTPSAPAPATSATTWPCSPAPSPTRATT